MKQHWSVQEGSIEIQEMPFYWRLSSGTGGFPEIPQRLGFRASRNPEFDYLEYKPNENEWLAINRAYRQNENIGFVNPESGQIHTYGSSVNNFFLKTVKAYSPKKIYEIGCGAGFSIQFLRENGWSVIGIDPSEYSLQWSKKLGFKLVNTFFDDSTLASEADLIYCNDVFEHVRNVEVFARNVNKSLRPGGVFCFSTTNSTESIEIGDISMFEHQHVNMFTTRSIHLILASAGFSTVVINKGSYGNTFQVIATKAPNGLVNELPLPICDSYFEKAIARLESFANFYKANYGRCQFYVPLRSIPYLATVGDFGSSDLFDSNVSWQGKFIDGYARPIKSISDLRKKEGGCFFVGSLTFFEEIKQSLIQVGYSDSEISSITNLFVKH